MPRVNSRLITVFGLAGLAGLLAAGGCGNKGPLYLPAPEAKPEAGRPAPPPQTAPPETSGNADG